MKVDAKNSIPHKSAYIALVEDSMEYRPFFQSAPALNNQYTDDIILQDVLQCYTSPDIVSQAEKELRQLGERVISRTMLDACQDAEQHQPFVEEYDSFGNRVSRLRTAAGWKYMKSVAAEEGVVASAYERLYGQHSRVVQLAKVYIYYPSSAMFGCPLAMTDGAARLLELTNSHAHIQARLCSRNTADMYTSGQWMTERVWLLRSSLTLGRRFRSVKLRDDCNSCSRR